LELSDKTFSLVIGIGMYLSHVFFKNIAGSKWQHTTKGSKRWIDYGQPVLASTGWRVFDPVRPLISLAYAVADGSWKNSRLKEIFEYEKAYVEQNTKNTENSDS
jgi:hypothetical protein